MDKYLSIFLLSFLALAMAACGHDEPNQKDEDNDMSSEAAKFVGTWFNNVSYGGIYYTFQSDGKCFSSPAGGNPDYLVGSNHRGTWKYLLKEKMLITTLEKGGDSWKIYDISDKSWTGQYQGSTFPTFSYIKYEEPPIPGKDQDWCPPSLGGRKLLMHINYASVDGDKIKEIYKFLFYNYNARCTCESSSKDVRSGYNYSFSKESANTCKLKLVDIGTIPEIYYDLNLTVDSNTTFTISGAKKIGKNSTNIISVNGNGTYIKNIM